MEEKRSAYRTQQGLEDIRIFMSLEGDEYTEVMLVDLSARGASIAIAVTEKSELSLAAGTEVHLTVQTPEIEPITDIVAVVRNHREEDGDQLFGLEVIDWERLHDRLPSDLFGAFNRRRHYRVSTPLITVKIVSEAGAVVSATMSDISTGGCSLLFEPAEPPMLSEVVQCLFCLPDSDHQFELSTIVRAVAKFRSGFRVGVQFSDEQSREFLADQRRISAYVMLRQRELRGSVMQKPR